MIDPTGRFSDRAEDYQRYRPSYPPGALELLEEELGLAPGRTVADLGSGTGIWSRLLLDRGCRVLAVEPNAAMRRAAEERLGGHPRFTSVAGRAEATGLPAGAADLATCAQAFHWFDRGAVRKELLRILRPPRPLAILWNERLTEGDPFLAAYEELLRRHGTDYRHVDYRRIGAGEIARFFGPRGCRQASFPNRQDLDLQGLRGLLLSASYAPGPEEPGHRPMLAELERIFAAHQEGGTVTLAYRTRVYCGRLT